MISHLAPWRVVLAALVLTVTGLTVAGCDSETDAAPTTLTGDAVAIGDGTARTYVTLSADGTPTAVGVALTADALSGLPDHDGGMGHEMDDMHPLPMPAGVQAKGVLTDHLSLDWNPHGHEPAGLFTVPHFDVHFYTVPMSERMTWMPGMPAFEQGATPPAAAYVPAGYAQLPGVVPAMGTHWMDTTDPTYAAGGPAFTEVFINGSFGGRMVFVEPMVTKAYLESLRASGAVHEEDLAQAAAVAATGLYPTTYSVRYDAARGEYRIELGGLVRRSAA